MNTTERFEQNLARWAVICPEGAAAIEKEADGEISHCGLPDGRVASREAEEWFSKLNLDQVSVLYVYGVGLGYAYEAAKQWLKDDESRLLVFLEDDPQVIRFLFQTETGSELLRNRQVFLNYFSKKLYPDRPDEKIVGIDSIVAPFCLYKFEVSALPAYLQSRVREFAEVKGLISFFSNIHKMDTLEYSHSGLVFFNNFFRNCLIMPQAYRADGFFGKFTGIPAIICGAGPSLDKNIDILATLQNRALIFAGGTALNALNAKGLLPHFGVGIDPNPDQFTRLVMNQAYETPFIYRNRMQHDALKMVHGEKLCVPGTSGYEIGGWFENKLGIKSQPIEEGYNVLNFSLSVAEAMGCNPIILVGIDLAYSQGRSYASGIISHPVHDRRRNFQTKDSSDELLFKKDIYGQPTETLWKWVGESFWYSRFALMHPDSIIMNATEGGLGFHGIKNITLAEAAKTYLSKQYDLDSLVHTEIQNNPMPPDVKESRIKAVLKSLQDSLERCGRKYQQMEDDLQVLNSASSQNQIDEVLSKVLENEKEVHQEEAYGALLKNFNDAFLKYSRLDLLKLNFDEGVIPKHEINLKRLKIDQRRYSNLRETALHNSTLIHAVCQEHDKLKQALAASEKNNDEYLKELRENYPPPGPSKAVTCQLDEKLFYYPDGSFHSLQRYRQGQKQGLQEYFYRNGLPRTRMSYESGRLNGKVLLFYPNGQLARELQFLDGKRYGPDRIWNEEGKLLIEAQFLGDRPVGIARKWYANGNLSCEITYGSDSQRISAQYWKPNGELVPDNEQEGYVGAVAKQTNKLTSSLSDVFSQVSNLVNQAPTGYNFSDDLKDLNKEMERLKEFGQSLRKEIEKENSLPGEDVWTDAAMKELEQQLAIQNKKMAEEMMSLEKGLKNVFNGLRKQNDKPPDEPNLDKHN